MLRVAEALLAEGKAREALANLNEVQAENVDASERLAFASLRLRIFLAIDRDGDAVADAYVEAVAAADAVPEDDVRRRVAYRKAFALHLVGISKPAEAERVALEALALLGMAHTSDYLLLNVISMQSTRSGAWALPFSRRAVTVADSQGHLSLGLASRIAVARHLWVSGRRVEAEAQFEEVLAFARAHDGHVDMALHSIEEIRAGRLG